jgi:hypothetical protein
VLRLLILLAFVVRDQEAGGSNPLAPTKFLNNLSLPGDSGNPAEQTRFVLAKARHAEAAAGRFYEELSLFMVGAHQLCRGIRLSADSEPHLVTNLNRHAFTVLLPRPAMPCSHRFDGRFVEPISHGLVDPEKFRLPSFIHHETERNR